MANNLQYAAIFQAELDKAAKEQATSGWMELNDKLVRYNSGSEVKIPMLDMDGLADYDRQTGFVEGRVDLTWQTKKMAMDRGRQFTFDEQEVNDTNFVLTASSVMGEFQRTKVVPELDAFRFACYAGKAGISKVSAGATLADGAAVLKAIREANDKMDEDEVPQEGRYLYITPTLMGMIQDLDTTKSREVLQNFAKTVKVPQTRFYTAIQQKSGKMTGDGEGAVDETAGGYGKAADAKEINFLIIHKPAVIQFPKHVAPKIISPEQNQTADAYKFGYRNVGIAGVYQNKLAGLYLHHKA